MILAGLVQLGAGAHFVKMSSQKFLIKMDEKVERVFFREVWICAHSAHFFRRLLLLLPCTGLPWPFYHVEH